MSIVYLTIIKMLMVGYLQKGAGGGMQQLLMAENLKWEEEGSWAGKVMKEFSLRAAA